MGHGRGSIFVEWYEGESAIDAPHSMCWECFPVACVLSGMETSSGVCRVTGLASVGLFPCPCIAWGLAEMWEQG